MAYIDLDKIGLFGMDVPEECCECKFCHEEIPGLDETRTFHCIIESTGVQDIFTKPKWCPIKEGTCTPLK